MSLIKIKKWFFLLFSLCLLSPFIAQAKGGENQALYLMQSKEWGKSLALYRTLFKQKGAHDFPLLRDLGHILLSQGLQDPEEESQLITMYGVGVAGIEQSIDLYQFGLLSRHPITQLVTVQFLSRLQDDRAEELLLKGFSSPFLLTRLETAHAFAHRRSNLATGLIEGLMHKLPPLLHIHFPKLFAMIGSTQAIEVLHKLARDRFLNVRLSAIWAAAQFGRDDFLSLIRAGATHLEEAEQEVCAAALGILNDSHSIPILKSLSASSKPNVKLAACHALSLLGEHSFWQQIIADAGQENPFAISLLESIPNTNALLVKLTSSAHFPIRVNAALALLKKRDPACLPTLLEILIKDERDLGFAPQSSVGGALFAWKVIPSSTPYAKKTKQNILATTLSLKEQILTETLELPEESFLEIANAIFEKKERVLIPHLVQLLENSRFNRATALLQKYSLSVGAPFIRNYCHLALYRMGVKGPHREILFDWVKKQGKHQLIRFRPIQSWTERDQEALSPYLLTPEETSRLVIEIFEALAMRHDPKGVDLLLHAIETGSPKNRYALAGLLIKALQ